MTKNTTSDIDSERYNRAFKLAIKHYWNVTKKNWKTSVPGQLLPAINIILIAYVPPIAVAKILSLTTNNAEVGFSEFMPYIALFAGSWLLGELIMRLGLHLLIQAQVNAVTQLYDNGLSMILRRDLSFFHDNFAGALTKKTLGYANRYINVSDTMALNVLNKLIPVIFASIVLSFYSPLLVICLLGWLILACLAIYPFIMKRRKLVSVRETASNVVSGHISDVYGNIDAIRAHASEKLEEKRNRSLVRDLMLKTRISWDYHNLRVDLITMPFYILTNVSGLVLALYLANQGTIEYASLIVTFTYYMLVTNFLWEFNHIYRQLESALSDAAQYTELLLTEPTIHNSLQPVSIPNPKGVINFKDIHFQYEEDSVQLFESFSLKIASGEKIGLVGRSGGGKTSVTKLLLRFSDIDEGSIEIDGVDIRKLKQEDLRALIAYVPQDPAMFHRSIHDNIAYGKPDATHDEVIAAAKKAHAHEFIKDLPQTYETLVGERGIKLSGGQRQRIAIARAILKDSPILLLDEATSALDSESEKLIQDALWKLMEGKTAIVIAHRLSTIQKMDRILVMDQGEIIQEGSHKELVEEKGIYSELWQHQSGGFLED